MTIGGSLIEVLKAFGNVIAHLVRSHPLFFMIALLILALTVYFLFGTQDKIVTFLTILISLISLVVYLYKDSYTEAFLTFFLGILTIFTIEWTDEKTVTFIISYFMLNISMLIGGSIKLNSKVETILMHSARYYDASDIKGTYKKLRYVVERQTSYRQINIIQKSEIVNFLSLLNVPISRLHNAIEQIEKFKTLTNADLSTSLNLFKLIFITTKSRFSDQEDIENHVRFHLDNLLVLPLTSDQMIHLFTETRVLLLKKKIEPIDYYGFLGRSFERGGTENEIIMQLKSIYKVED